MKILVACECSGIVREAFASKGHDAWSCDILPTDMPGQHIQGDVLEVLDRGWDMIIAFPPCTHLSASGAQYWPAKVEDGRQPEAVEFFMKMISAKAPRIAVENPVGLMSKVYQRPDQYIQPFEHGHRRSKKTCLWLKGLPLLEPTEVVEPEWIICKGKRYSPDHYSSFGRKDRAKFRSITYQGIANAMADQWG